MPEQESDVWWAFYPFMPRREGVKLVAAPGGGMACASDPATTRCRANPETTRIIQMWIPEFTAEDAHKYREALRILMTYDLGVTEDLLKRLSMDGIAQILSRHERSRVRSRRSQRLEPENPDAHLSCSDLADRYDVGLDALRKRLERFRRDNDAGWVEVTDPGVRDAVYLYRIGSVASIIEAMRTSAETSAERPLTE